LECKYINIYMFFSENIMKVVGRVFGGGGVAAEE
jgi:hypothetical protein